MTYLTQEEFDELGFDEVTDFEKLAKRAKIAIDLYTDGIYQKDIDFEKEIAYRKSAVKLAMAFQIAYLDASGIMSADDKQQPIVSLLAVHQSLIAPHKAHQQVSDLICLWMLKML